MEPQNEQFLMDFIGKKATKSVRNFVLLSVKTPADYTF